MHKEYFSGFVNTMFLDNERSRKIIAAIWYPTDDNNRNGFYYLSSIKSSVIKNAEIASGEFPLVIISHGSRGHRFNQYFLAEHLSKNGVIVVAVEHPGDSAFDYSLCDKKINFLHRPKDIEFVYDGIMRKKSFNKHININKIGLIGHSFGGYTAFVLAGGRPINLPYEIKIKTELTKNIKAMVLFAPALIDLFDKGMSRVDVPTLLIKSGRDELLGEKDLGYMELLKNKKVIILENAGHYVYLMDYPDIIKKKFLAPWNIDIGTPRKEIHPILINEVENFFNMFI